jgi:hypothetical protein
MQSLDKGARIRRSMQQCLASMKRRKFRPVSARPGVAVVTGASRTALLRILRHAFALCGAGCEERQSARQDGEASLAEQLIQKGDKVGTGVANTVMESPELSTKAKMR